MFQKEVAERIVAAPGNKDFGRLSVLAQWRSDARIVMNVHRSAFVNWKRLKAVRRDANGRLMAVLESGDEVPVSRAYAQRVMAEMKQRS